MASQGKLFDGDDQCSDDLAKEASTKEVRRSLRLSGPLKVETKRISLSDVFEFPEHLLEGEALEDIEITLVDISYDEENDEAANPYLSPKKEKGTKNKYNEKQNDKASD